MTMREPCLLDLRGAFDVAAMRRHIEVLVLRSPFHFDVVWLDPNDFEYRASVTYERTGRGSDRCLRSCLPEWTHCIRQIKCVHSLAQSTVLGYSRA